MTNSRPLHQIVNDLAEIIRKHFLNNLEGDNAIDIDANWVSFNGSVDFHNIAKDAVDQIMELFNA